MLPHPPAARADFGLQLLSGLGRGGFVQGSLLGTASTSTQPITPNSACFMLGLCRENLNIIAHSGDGKIKQFCSENFSRQVTSVFLGSCRTRGEFCSSLMAKCSVEIKIKKWILK